MRRLTYRPYDFRLDRKAPLAQGLVFAGLGACAGTTRYRDSSGCGLDGTLTGFSGAGDTPQERWLGDGLLRRQVLSFDGSNDYVLGLSSSALNLTGDFTLSVWANAVSYPTYGTLMGARTTYAGMDWWWLDGYLSTTKFFFGNAGAVTISCYNSPSAGVWHHHAITRRGSIFTPYLDGVAATTTNNATAMPTGDALRIGIAGGDAAYYRNGKLADPLIYQRALTAPEILRLADRSNVDMDGAIVDRRRRVFPVAVGGFQAAWARHSNTLIGA